jgi:hypothetical protein
MPLKSQAQRGLFRWAEAHPKEAAARGIKPSVAKEFNDSDTGGKLPERVSKSRDERKAARYGGSKAS